jgi:hypothetical protein
MFASIGSYAAIVDNDVGTNQAIIANTMEQAADKIELTISSQTVTAVPEGTCVAVQSGQEILLKITTNNLATVDVENNVWQIRQANYPTENLMVTIRGSTNGYFLIVLTDVSGIANRFSGTYAVFRVDKANAADITAKYQYGAVAIINSLYNNTADETTDLADNTRMTYALINPRAGAGTIPLEGIGLWERHRDFKLSVMTCEVTNLSQENTGWRSSAITDEKVQQSVATHLLA